MKATPRSARRNRQDKESGATAIEFVLWTPLLFLFMFGSVQFGLAVFARHVAVTAAQEGARTAREQAESNPNGWQEQAEGDSVKWVNDLIGGLVSDGVQANPITAKNIAYPEVGMEVSFSIVSVVPDWQFHLDAVSEGPIECYYTQAGACVGPNG